MDDLPECDFVGDDPDSDRPKTIQAIKTVLESLSAHRLHTLRVRWSRSTLRRRDGVEPDVAGQTRRLTGCQCSVYLPFNIERYDQPDLDSVVADEFAHVLNVQFWSASRMAESMESDRVGAKMIAWGFAPRPCWPE